MHGMCAGAQACVVLAPIWRVGKAEGVADAAFLADAVLGGDMPPGGLDILGPRPRLCRRKCGVKPLDHYPGGVSETRRRFAKKHRTRHWAVIAETRAGELEDGRVAALEGLIGPGEMRRSRPFAGWQQGADRRVVAAEFGRARDLGAIDLGDGIALTASRHDSIDAGGHGAAHQHGRLSDIAELSLGFY